MHTHFVATVIWRVNPETQDIELMVIDYRSTDPRTGRKTELQTKFVGGTNKECPNESVEGTRDREVLEETNLTFQNSRQIWKKEVSPQHTKYGYLVDFKDCDGAIRNGVLVDDGDELSKPYWVSARTLGRILFRSHQELYMVAIDIPMTQFGHEFDMD